MEDLKSVYNEKFYIWDSVKPEKTWGFEELKKFVALVEKGRVLDLGCAAGAHSKFISDAGLNVVGVDFSGKMIEAAKKKSPGVKFLSMDILDLDFPPDYFDGIFARASLLHLRKNRILAALKELKEILKLEGVVYIALKKGAGERNVSDKDRGTRFYAFYEESEITGLIEQVRLKVLECYTTKADTNIWIHCFAKKV